MRVDHLVWWCSDLSQGERFFEAELGCAPAFGGVHPGEGTRNSLLSVGEATYVEILGRDPAQPQSSLDAELRDLEGSSGLYHWAIGTNDLGGVIAMARRNGLEMGEIVRGGRDLPSGGRIEWQVAGLQNHTFGALAPFFIDWRQSSHPALTAPRAGRLGAVEAFTPDATALRHFYKGIGLEEIAVSESAEAAMKVEIIGKHGSKFLKSIRPAPRGFVIRASTAEGVHD